jgi:hypothetical protein
MAATTRLLEEAVREQKTAPCALSGVTFIVAQSAGAMIPHVNTLNER